MGERNDGEERAKKKRLRGAFEKPLEKSRVPYSHLFHSPAASLPSPRVGVALVFCFVVTWALFGFWTGVATLIAAVFLLAAVYAYDLTGELTGLWYQLSPTLA